MAAVHVLQDPEFKGNVCTSSPAQTRDDVLQPRDGNNQSLTRVLKSFSTALSGLSKDGEIITAKAVGTRWLQDYKPTDSPCVSTPAQKAPASCMATPVIQATPLTHASGRGHDEAMELLRDAMAQIEATREKSASPVVESPEAGHWWHKAMRTKLKGESYDAWLAETREAQTDQQTELDAEIRSVLEALKQFGPVLKGEEATVTPSQCPQKAQAVMSRALPIEAILRAKYCDQTKPGEVNGANSAAMQSSRAPNRGCCRAPKLVPACVIC